MTKNNIFMRVCKGFICLAVILTTCLLCAGSVYSADDSAASDMPEIGEYIHVAYGDSDGLLSNEANVVLSSSEGYVWIGSYSGLSRYDGNSFVTYSDDDDSIMKGVSVRTLYEDSRGRLWIGSNERGAFFWENGSFTKIDISAVGISNTIRAFAEDGSGTVYIASTSGIARVDENLQVSAVHIDGVNPSAIVTLTADHKGNLWIVDKESIFVLHDEKVFFSLNTANHMQLECVSITELSNGNMLIGSSGNQIMELSPSIAIYSMRVLDAGDCYSINSIYEDSYGRVWVACDNGVGYMQGDKAVLVSGISFTTCEHITEDYEGNLWLASSREGLLELVRGKFNITGIYSGLSDITVNATLIYEGYLFAATDNGVMVLDRLTYEPVLHMLTDLLQGIRVRGLYRDSKGYLWISTYKDFGVIRYKNGSYISINTANGLTSNKVRVVMEQKNGDIAVSTGRGVNIIRDGAVIRTYTEADGLENPVILCMCADNSGRLYFGSDGNGIYTVDSDGTVKNYTSADGLGSDVILNMLYDPSLDAIWVSTGSNLAIWDKDGIRNLESFTAGTGSIFEMKFVGQKMWILRSTNVVIATREQLLSGVPDDELVVLGKKDGLYDITSNSRHDLSADRILYLATGNGVLTIDTGNIYTNPAVPQAVINSVIVDGTVYNNPKTIELPADTQSITIEFSALNYSTGNCQVEYQLLGVDEVATVVTDDKSLSRDYNNLKGGTYIFRVSVTSPAGVKSSSQLELIIRKQLAMYEKPLFIGSMILLGLLLIFLLVYVSVKVRTNKLVERQESYRHLTESALRTAARMIDAKDSYTKGHSYRVASCAREIAHRLGWSAHRQESIYYTALVHDIGKIGIRDSVLNKPAKLTPEEYVEIQRHPEIGYQILSEFEGLPGIEQGARYHHERYDGCGYCHGLSGEDIPLVARIIAVADTYDAMASPRVYRPALPVERIREELENGKGKQFDPNIASIMLQMISDGFQPQE